MSGNLKSLLVEWAQQAGFDAVRVTRPDESDVLDAGQHLSEFIADGRHGDMIWMENTEDRRRNPRTLWPDVKSIVMLGSSYAPEGDPLAGLAHPSRGVVSCYAKGSDYHELLKAKLKTVARQLAMARGAEVKVFVDTAPLMEKPLAQSAGVGWQGKHTNLVSRQHGSWLFLGAILTTAEIEPDTPAEDLCGSCRRCLDVCPTNAFPAPYQLDARRCIAYLTIEHKGHIAEEFRGVIGNRVFGCDDCLAVCPWNKFAAASREARFKARGATDDPPLAELLQLDDAAFRKRFAGTPIKRSGRDRLVRNALIAAGNSRDQSLVPAVLALLSDASPIVRAMAVWAAHQLGATPMNSLATRLAALETDENVKREWERVLQMQRKGETEMANA